MMGTKYPILDFFAFAHLPEYLRVVSAPFADLAQKMSEQTEKANGETAAGLRKLLEAKDCAVRATIAERAERAARE